jgi:hypothetical protein
LTSPTLMGVKGLTAAAPAGSVETLGWAGGPSSKGKRAGRVLG